MLGSVLLGALAITSCSTDKLGGNQPFDPGKAIVIKDFYPDSGGVATPMILHGQNFGADTIGLKLFYIDEDGVKHRGGLVSVGYDSKKQQDVMYAYVPSGLTYKRNIKLQVEREKDGQMYASSEVPKPFYYKTQAAVTTVIGLQSNDQRQTKLATLGSTQLSAPAYLCIDNEDNIFISQRNIWKGYINLKSLNEKNEEKTTLLKANLEKDEIVTLAQDESKYGFNAPAFSDEPGAEAVYVPHDEGLTYVSADKNVDYVGRKQKILPAQGSEKLSETNYKYSFVVNKNDKMIYTVMFKGQLVRINPKTRRATLLLNQIGEHKGWQNDGNDAFCAFSPVEPNRLFICLKDAGEIWYVDVDKLGDKDSINYHGEPYAGRAISEGVEPGRGYEDGKLRNAKFNRPHQICFTSDGKMYIADALNHCIRQIDTTLGSKATVTTIIGLPGNKGFADGGPEIAKFNSPTGVAVSADGKIVYVSDFMNQVVRKLSVE